MATAFNVTLKSSAGDATTLNTLVKNSTSGGLGCDITAAGTKVFSCGAFLHGTIAANTAVTGATSGATGTMVWKNVAATQVLIKSITGTFQSGETVYKTSDGAAGTNDFALSNAGDSAIPTITCFGFQDTTTAAFAGWTTGSSNYVRIVADSTAVATLPYTSSGYRLERSGGFNCMTGVPPYCRFERLSFKLTARAVAEDLSVATPGNGTAGHIRFDSCYMLGVMHASNTTQIRAVGSSNNDNIVVVNCVIDGWTHVGNTTNAALGGSTTGGGATLYAENNLFINCARGMQRASGTWTAKNCCFDNGSATLSAGFTGTIGGTNNCSVDATCPATNAHNSVTFTYINSGTGDYHIATGDAGAKAQGSDLSADGTFAFSTDIDGNTRSGTWDAGPTKAPTVAGSADDSSLTRGLQRGLRRGLALR
jgi:hypothetical protein